MYSCIIFLLTEGTAGILSYTQVSFIALCVEIHVNYYYLKFNFDSGAQVLNSLKRPLRTFDWDCGTREFFVQMSATFLSHVYKRFFFNFFSAFLRFFNTFLPTYLKVGYAVVGCHDLGELWDYDKSKMRTCICDLCHHFSICDLQQFSSNLARESRLDFY